MVLIILTTVILILFLYYREAPEIKASSPYLGLTMFLECFFLFASGVIEATFPSVIHDGVFFCNVVQWSLGIGVHLILAPLFMRMLRVHRIFTYFGKLGKQWSDGVLFAGILALVGTTIIFLTVLQVVGTRNGVNFEMLVIPEGSFPYYEVVQASRSASIQYTENFFKNGSSPRSYIPMCNYRNGNFR